MPLSVLDLAPTASVLAQNGQQAAPGFDPFFLIMIALFGLMIFFMFRKSKKVQQQQQEMRSTVAPGVEVLTSMGLFGRVVSVDQEENKVVLELSPGTTATVHMQAIGQVVDPVSTEAEVQAEGFDTPGYEQGTEYDLNGESSRPAGDPTDPRGPQDPQDPRPDAGRPQL